MKSRRTVKKKTRKTFLRGVMDVNHTKIVCAVWDKCLAFSTGSVWKVENLITYNFNLFFCNENLCKFTQMHNLHAYRGSHTRMMSTRKTPTVFMRRVNIFLICQYVFAIIVQIFGVLFSFGWFVILRGSTGSSSIHQELNKSKIKRQKSYTKLQSIW